MTLRETSNNQSNRGLDNQFANSRQNGDNFPAQCDILITVEAIELQHNWIGPNIMANFTANSSIFLVSNTTQPGESTAYSSLQGALEHASNDHGDINAEGSALMLEAASGLVPATIANLKKSCARRMRLVASSQGQADNVVAAQSKLDGALSACALVGVDPDNVATVGNLRAALVRAQEEVVSSDDCAVITIEIKPLYKRKHNRRPS